MNRFITHAGILVAYYLLAGFIGAEFNPFEWHVLGRFGLVAISICTSLCYESYLLENEKPY